MSLSQTVKSASWAARLFSIGFDAFLPRLKERKKVQKRKGRTSSLVMEDLPFCFRTSVSCIQEYLRGRHSWLLLLRLGTLSF